MATPATSPTPEQVQAAMQALLNGPAGKPPAGVTPNFMNPPNLDAIIVPILALCLAITTCSVLIRSYTKYFLLRSVAFEDYIIVIAWVGQVGFTVPSVLDFKSGGGAHMWDVRLKDFFRLLYWLNISGILYGIIVCLIKESILLQYLRIFVPNRKGNMALYLAIQVLIWSILLFYLVDTVFEIIMCSPREKIWNLLMTTGHCFNENAAYEATGTFNVISDFSILALPMVPIWKLQMPPKKKIMIIAVFATGIGACVTSVLRTYYTFRIVQSPDVSYNVIIMGLWTWAEITSGILISCLPVMPKFFHSVGSKIHGTFSSSSKPRSKLLQNSQPTDNKKKMGVSIPFTRPFDKSSGSSGHTEVIGDPCSQQIRHKGEYITLDEFDVATSGEDPNNGRRSVLREEEGTATRREDLEMGRYAI